jgi:hypothetical protein
MHFEYLSFLPVSGSNGVIEVHSLLVLPLYSEQYLYLSTHEEPTIIQVFKLGSEDGCSSHKSSSLQL